MGLFSNRFSKEGPGIPKDAPRKKGLALFFDILFREFWQLIKLNLIFILACIPIVTIFPAIGGLTYVTVKMVRDENTFVWYDFWKGFKENWKKSLVVGIIGTFLMFSILSSFYIAIYDNNSVFMVFGILLGLFAGVTYINIYPMIVAVDITFKNAVKNSILLGISCLNYTLPALVIIVTTMLVSINFIFYLLPVIILILFSFTNLIASFAAWAGIKKHVIKEEL